MSRWGERSRKLEGWGVVLAAVWTVTLLLTSCGGRAEDQEKTAGQPAVALGAQPLTAQDPCDCPDGGPDCPTECPGGKCVGGRCCTGCVAEGICRSGDAIEYCGILGNTCSTCPRTQTGDCNPYVCEGGLCPRKPRTGEECSDKNACTENDRCAADGRCQGGAPKSCEDNNPCTTDTCAPSTGVCSNQPNSNACDDGNPTTCADRCQNGQCEGGTNCEDNNPCTIDSCDPGIGCRHEPSGNTCDDGNPLTCGDRCDGIQCQGVSCEDNNPCTRDSCGGSGCVHDFEPNSATCAGGHCLNGQCCEGCIDGATCRSGSDLDSCGLAGGACIRCPDDGNACTERACRSGVCGSEPEKVCNDGNPCTTDRCDRATGNCAADPNTNACDDGNSCTSSDRCEAGSCRGTPAPCETRECNVGQCVNGACQFTPGNEGGLCSNGRGHCARGVCCLGCVDGAGRCLLGNVPASCGKDGNLCQPCPASTNACQRPTCVNHLCGLENLEGLSCRDSNLCNGQEVCRQGRCQAGTPLNCDDQNACTTDSRCDTLRGCSRTNNTGACDDHDACTVQDRCAAGKCQPGVKVQCTDDNSCTSDTCNKGQGCVFPVLPDNTACPDICGEKAQCKGGKCLSLTGKPPCDDLDPCTRNDCNALTKDCTFPPEPDGTLCNADACHVNSTCQGGKCQPGEEILCDDGNPCNLDRCDSRTGCVHEPLGEGVLCNDGNPCTANDLCKNGGCVGDPEGVCPPKDDCHEVPSCDPQTGACGEPLPKPDGSPCRIGESKGLCKGGSCEPDDTGTGGTAGSGGSGGSGGVSGGGGIGGVVVTDRGAGSGGSLAGSGGTGGRPPRDPGGCSCRLPFEGGPGAPRNALGLMALSLITWARLRRRMNTL